MVKLTHLPSHFLKILLYLKEISPLKQKSKTFVLLACSLDELCSWFWLYFVDFMYKVWLCCFFCLQPFKDSHLYKLDLRQKKNLGQKNLQKKVEVIFSVLKKRLNQRSWNFCGVNPIQFWSLKNVKKCCRIVQAPYAIQVLAYFFYVFDFFLRNAMYITFNMLNSISSLNTW